MCGQMGFKYLMFSLADNYFLVITQVVEPNSGVKNAICITQTCIMQYIAAVKNSQQNRNLYSYITSIVISFMNMAGGGGIQNHEKH